MQTVAKWNVPLELMLQMFQIQSRKINSLIRKCSLGCEQDGWSCWFWPKNNLHPWDWGSGHQDGGQVQTRGKFHDQRHYVLITFLLQDKSGVPCHEYFFGPKNVTFCGFHPRDHRYFAFITKVTIQWTTTILVVVHFEMKRWRKKPWCPLCVNVVLWLQLNLCYSIPHRVNVMLCCVYFKVWSFCYSIPHLVNVMFKVKSLLQYLSPC